MINVIKNFANLIEENRETCDCAVVIVLSHGGNGKIYAVDELALDVGEPHPRDDASLRPLLLLYFVRTRSTNTSSLYSMIVLLANPSCSFYKHVADVNVLALLSMVQMLLFA